MPGARRGRTGWRGLTGLAAALGSVGLLSGCGVKPAHTLDATSAAHQIQSQLAARYPGTTPTVTCPSGVRAHSGQTFTCNATLDGQPLTIQGTVSGNGGHFDVALGSAVVVVRDAADQLARDITAQTHLQTTVSCGTRTVLVVNAGGKFGCTANLHGEKPRAVTVTVVDAAGHVRYSLAPPAA